MCINGLNAQGSEYNSSCEKDQMEFGILSETAIISLTLACLHENARHPRHGECLQT